MKVKMNILKNWSQGKESPQVELAFKARVSTGTVSKLFNGLAPKKENTRIKIASAIGVDESDLFQMEPENLAS